jgi:pentatricopeptide repeat protein
VRLLDEMRRRGAPPNHITYCALINACLRHDDVGRARTLFLTQEEHTGVPPTLQVYNAMVAGLCKCGDEFNVDAAVRILGRMRAGRPGAAAAAVAAEGEEGGDRRSDGYGGGGGGGGVAPSDVTYNAVIDGLVRFNRVHDAEDVLEWMREDGVTPSVITYTTLIKGWGAERDLAEARRVFRCMTRDGIEPDTLALNALINACVRAENPAAAARVLDVMESGAGDGDVAPDVYSYTPLIAVHTRRGRLDDVWSVYERARRHGMVVNKYVANLVVSAVVTLGAKPVRQGRPAEREAIAAMAVAILDHAWDDCRDKGAGRVWRRRLLAIFAHDAELAARVGRAGGGGALRSASEVIFERHGWNEISSGWRAF